MEGDSLDEASRKCVPLEDVAGPILTSCAWNGVLYWKAWFTRLGHEVDWTILTTKS